jgi:hypothetical protein
MRHLVAGRRLLMNCGLAGMVAGTFLAVGVHWDVSKYQWQAPADTGAAAFQSFVLVLVGGLVGLVWGVVYLTVEDFDAGDHSRLDYDEPISWNCPPGST